MKLEGRVAIVTGAGSGIGAASARLFAAEGARLALVDLDEQALDRVAGEIRAAGGGVRTYPADVTDAAAAGRAVADLLGAWGRIDVLMTSAGVSPGGAVPTIAEDAWERTFAVNVKGTYLWARAVLGQMIAERRGAIVTVGSQLAMNNLGNNAAYIASKGAIVSLTRAMAVDHAAAGVRVNCVMPGATETAMIARSLARHPDAAERRRRWEGRHPLGRFARPEEVAKAALFLASDDSSFTTGSLLFVDGGWTAA
ncbi:MAG: glucose 1-dehydrogenase [Proteobacteria bacterium]|nr:glucose 1-dehydrogenase [Pseudomonadota bacterium]